MEFDAPVGYQEPKVQKKAEDPVVDETMYTMDTQNFTAFSGEGNRLDGKKKKIEKVETNSIPKVNY